MLERLDVYAQRGEHLQYTVEQDPPAETGLAGRAILEVGGELEVLELVDQRVAADGGIQFIDVGGVAEDDGELEVGFRILG